jgi:asparagine synthase (glutamine-hydrolysing)
MCGINGFNWNDGTLIESMNRTTRNRGPDDCGVYADENVSLGHNRLSIIDLSENGHQPMSNEDGTVWIVFNGEVYNFMELREELIAKGHVFKSNTDTEAIIHAYEEYGFDIVKRFNGMWAFGIYDRNKNVLFLSRDQFGIKPLYYYIDDSRIVFSSMIAGIMAHGVETGPNEKAIMEYLAFNLEDYETHTFFKNVSSLARDSYLVYDLTSHEHTITRWYTPGKRPIKDKDDVRNIFTESVKLRTIADVPIGSCLSGGIDSSSIVCTLDEILKEPFYTFSFVSPGSPLDESRYIEEIGKTTNTRQFFTAMDGQTFLEEFYDFVEAQEEPVTGLSPYAQYRVMKLAHQHGAKVLLDGQGADEIFAGYVYYFSYYFYELFTSLKWYTLLKESASYVSMYGSFYPHSMFAFMLMPVPLRYRMWKKFINPWVNHEYLKSVCKDAHDPRWDPMRLNDALSLTLFSTAIPEMLRWEDKNSMRWSIETRPPFLDVALVESVLPLPSEMKLKNGTRKKIFKDAMKDVIPSMIGKRNDKIGFAAPIDEFFRDERIVPFLKDIIYSDSFKGRPYWNWDVAEKIFTDHVAGKRNSGDTIFKWVNLEVWLRKYFPGQAASASC